MNSKGISLAINQVVILVVGITILSFGFVFLFNVFSAAEQQLPSLDARLEEQLIDSLRRGEIVEIPMNTKTVRRSDLGVYSLGIRNDNKISLGDNQFTVLISYRSGGCADDICKNTWIDEGFLGPDFELSGSSPAESRRITKTIPAGNSEVITFGLSPKNANQGLGQHFFNVCVCFGSDASGNNCKDGNLEITSCSATSYEAIDNAYSFKTFSINVR